MKSSIPVVAVLMAGCTTTRYVSVPTYSAATYSAPIATTPIETAPATRITDLRSLLEGSVIVAEDGQKLGVITSNPYDADSFLNQYGSYGSKYSSTSIWNEYGSYGGQYSLMSPFNPYSITPPRIFTTNGLMVGYLTVNSYKTPAIDPYALVALMK